MDDKYTIFCFECKRCIGHEHSFEAADVLRVKHILQSPHIFVSVLEQDDVERLGIRCW